MNSLTASVTKALAQQSKHPLEWHSQKNFLGLWKQLTWQELLVLGSSVLGRSELDVQYCENWMWSHRHYIPVILALR